MSKEYEGTCYIGVVGPELEYGLARDSIQGIERRPADGPVIYARATKGYEGRQKHINNFMESKHDFCLLLDHDMTFAPNTLERLRAHKLPFVSGLYMRRSISPMAPIWFKPWAGSFPYEPWMDAIEPGKLYEIGASGWGCILVHRDVVTAVRKITKGEYDILEDDMDVWPYDLGAIMGAVRGLRKLCEQKPDDSITWPALDAFTHTLESEIRPLRADREQIGSDIRFPFYARTAGFTLYGDPDVTPGHILHYPLGIADFRSTMAASDPQAWGEHKTNFHGQIMRDRARLRRQKAELVK